MIGTKIQECPELTNPTGDEKIPVSDGSGQAKVVKFRNINTTTQAIANANAAAQTATEKIAELQALLDDAQDALTDMQDAAAGVTQAISDATRAASTAQMMSGACQTAGQQAYSAAEAASTAAQSANNAYYRLTGLINQINGLIDSVSDLEERQLQMLDEAVTFDSGTSLPAQVQLGTLFYDRVSDKTYIGVPGRKLPYYYFETQFLGKHYADRGDIIELTDYDNSKYKVCFTQPQNSSSYLLEQCNDDGTPQGYFLQRDNGDRIHWSDRGSTGDSNNITVQVTPSQPIQWKEI